MAKKAISIIKKNFFIEIGIGCISIVDLLLASFIIAALIFTGPFKFLSINSNINAVDKYYYYKFLLF